MDPTQSLRDLLDALAGDDIDRAHECADDLRTWLLKGGFSPVPEDAKRHNGWANYETWAVNVWLTGDERIYRFCQRIVRNAARDAADCDQVEDGVWTLSQARKFILADRLKDALQEGNPLRDDASVYCDLLGAAIEEIDWQELAVAFLETTTP